MKYKYNSLWIGLILGIIIPCFAVLFFWISNLKSLPFSEFFVKLTTMNVLSKLVSLCVLPNLLVFFIFIWKNLLYSARGVLFATLIWTIIVVIIKFFIQN